MNEKIDERIQELQDNLAERKQIYFSTEEGCVNPQAVEQLKNAITELENPQNSIDSLSKQNSKGEQD